MQGPGEPETYRSAGCLITPATRRLLRDGQDVDVEGKVFDLIVLLVRDHQRALDKQEIIEAMWGLRPITDAALSQLIYKARRACGDDGEHQNVIRTIYGRGLQWVAPVEVVHADKPVAAEDAPTHLVPGKRRPRWADMAATSVAVLLCVGLAWWLIPRGSSEPSSALPRVALLPIDNATGDKAQAWTSQGIPGLMGSLLGQSRHIDVIDPLQVARVWRFTLPAGGDRIRHAKDATGASVIVSGKLSKLGHLYALSLHVDRGTWMGDDDIVLTGSEPSHLAVAAVPRIRQALDLTPPRLPTQLAQPVNAYLAQTYALGMDAGMHGRWSDAKPYFALCARKAPGFLPCRLRLGQAQASTNQLAEAGKTLADLLTQARKRHDTRLVALTLYHLARISLVRHEHATALKQLQQAAPLAETVGDIDLQTNIALGTVNVAAHLKRFDLAENQLRLAGTWIDQHGLKAKQADLYNSQASLAISRGDYAGAERADRAALAASVDIGNATNAVGDAYNLGLALLRQKKAIQALPLLAYTFRQGRRLHNTDLEFSSGDNLAIALLNAGATQPLPAITERLFAIGRTQKNPVWQAFAWILRGGRQWYDGDRAGALKSARQSVALVDPQQAPALWIALQYNVATAALFEDRAALPALSKQVDAVVSRQHRPADYGYTQWLIRAFAEAASSDSAAARAALRKAAATAHPGDPGNDDLHRAGLAIALATRDRDAARIVLEHFDPAQCQMADVLQLYMAWQRQLGDEQEALAAGQRLARLRDSMLAALRSHPPGIPAGAGSVAAAF
ncbi:MAG TPA: winged helix-turn-helix domain-containing protein [Rhodanobacteraceae bacterium]|nr:winged helix-turn-helix domain-containing protein [Rhodanobacteraceae bacterium]